MNRPEESNRDPELLAFVQRWQTLIEERGICQDCMIEVEREDHWFVIHGWVNSFGTKGMLFELVPEIDGARWIVDRVRVGRPARDKQRDASSSGPAEVIAFPSGDDDSKPDEPDDLKETTG
jgi:hypothetical protein